MDPDRIPEVLTELQRVWLEHPDNALCSLLGRVTERRSGLAEVTDEYLLKMLKLVATGPFITKSGRVLTDADFEQLADEAERGYVSPRFSLYGPNAVSVPEDVPE